MDTREELDFMLDEEMEELNLQKRSFAKWDSDSEDEITDADVRKIIIVIQVKVVENKRVWSFFALL